MSATLLPHQRAGAGVPLVLVHGYLGGSQQWAQEIAHFSTRFDVIAPALPGFADAAELHAKNRISDMADAIITLLDDLKLTRFILMGHSMGGMVAQEIAAKVGDRVLGLILYGTGPIGLLPDRFEPIEVSRQRLIADGVEKTSRRIAATWFRDGEAATGYELVAKIGSSTSREAALAGLDAMAHWDGRSALPFLTMPTLILWGELDRTYHWSQIELLWRMLPNAQLAVIPGAAHATNLEKPHLFNTVLEDFLKNF
ncbi:alpha/beta hydrolase [Yoonia sp.]|uniref:alpha/beta fold hydrolase n=1 Tax=Yoonia sp. TaxID=2212373 RepID=UPI001A093B54|nr:alpha/beta hydrolase [Yoonia sp.]MBE0412765.1 alpha/beta hydrolase [Yoonia sp.]